MAHKFKGKKYFRTTWMKGKEYDIYTLPDGRVVAYSYETGKPERMWENLEDFKFTNMLLNL